MQQSLNTIDLVLFFHYAVTEMGLERFNLPKVTCMINFRAWVLSAKIGLARSIECVCDYLMITVSNVTIQI